MLQMHANHREDIKEARAGDIVALAGLKNTTTGDTLCDPSHAGRARAHGVPRSGHRDRGRAEDQGRPGEDGPGAGPARAPRIPRSASSVDHESGQTIIKGMGELHLEIIVDRMKREFKVEANVGAPQVAYRETITRKAEIDYTHKKQTGGSGQFAASRSASSRCRRAPASSSRTTWSAARCRRNTCRASRRASTAAGQRRARRLPGDRLQGAR